MERERLTIDSKAFRASPDGEVRNWLIEVLDDRLYELRSNRRWEGQPAFVEYLYGHLPSDQKSRFRRVFAGILESVAGDPQGVMTPEGADALLLTLNIMGQKIRDKGFREGAASSLKGIVSNEHSKGVLTRVGPDRAISLHWRACQTLIGIHEPMTPEFWEDLVTDNGAEYVILGFGGLQNIDVKEAVNWMRRGLEEGNYTKELIMAFLGSMAYLRERDGRKLLNWACGELLPVIESEEYRKDVLTWQDRLQGPIPKPPFTARRKNP